MSLKIGLLGADSELAQHSVDWVTPEKNCSEGDKFGFLNMFMMRGKDPACTLNITGRVNYFASVGYLAALGRKKWSVKF